MIASVRGLVVLASIAAVLAIVVVLGGGTHVAADRAVLPGFTGDAHSLRWVRSTGEVRIDRAGDRWRFGTRLADVHEVLGALRAARWHRRADRTRAGVIRSTLWVDDRAIELGQAIEGADQVWVVVDGRALLVDGWLARALDPDPLALIDRTPLAGAATAATIRVGDVTLTGMPRRSPAGLVAPRLVDALTDALAALAIVRLGPVVDAPRETVALGSATFAIGGACAGGLVALRAADGDGCVEADAWRAVVAAATAVAAPDAVDVRPAAFEISRITLPDGSLDLAKRARVTLGGVASDADPDRAAELVAALAQPGELVAMPGGPPRASLVVTPRVGEPITLDVYAAAIARRGEPRALRVSPAALAMVLRPARALLDASRWAEDPTAVSRLVLDGVTFDRGAVIGEWTRTPAGHVDAPLVDALAATAAQVRAPEAPLPAGFRAAHHLAVTLAPPVGAKVTHELELGPPSPTGCAATIDRTPVTAPLALCTAAAAVAH